MKPASDQAVSIPQASIQSIGDRTFVVFERVEYRPMPQQATIRSVASSMKSEKETETRADMNK